MVLVIVAAGTFAGLFLLLTSLTIAPVSAVPLEAANTSLSGIARKVPESVVPDGQLANTLLVSPMELFVNYAHDWVGGNTTVSTTVFFTDTSYTDGPAIVDWQWVFGDGSPSVSTQDASHTYSVEGVYAVTLVVTDALGYGDSVSITVTVESPDLVANFDQSATAVPIHSTVYFTDTSTTDGPAIMAWTWDFGDGSALVHTQNTSHLYSVFGSFDVTLVATDEHGYTDSHIVQDAVSTLAPVFVIGNEYDSSQIAGTLVTYTLTFSNIGSLSGTGLVITDQLPTNVTWISGGSYDAGSGIITWNWPSLAPGSSGSVQFVGELGCSGQVVNDNYQVASSDQGSSSPTGDPVSFTIQNPTIVAGFIQSAAQVRPGESVVFTSTSTSDGPALISWFWDFGDGGSANGPIVSHAYAQPDYYDVELTVSDACGFSDTTLISNAVLVDLFKLFVPFVMKPS